MEKILIKLDELLKKLEDLKQLNYKSGKSEYYEIRDLIARIIKIIYNAKDAEKLIKDLNYEGISMAPASEGFYQSKYISNIEKAQRHIKTIKSEYELTGFNKNTQKEDVLKSLTINNYAPSNNAIASTNVKQDINQINTFNEIYTYIDSLSIENKKNIKEKVQEIEEEVKKDNISKSKIKKALVYICKKGKDAGKEIVYQISKAFFDKILSGD